MGRFLIGKLAYGLLVLWGVITVVFFLFNLSPGDPVRNLVGENAPEDVVMNIRQKLDLDLPLGVRYICYLNDLSPISVYHTPESGIRPVWSEEVQGGWQVTALGKDRLIVLKAPYFKRSFLSDRSVSDILAEAIPGTVVLAVVSILLALLAGMLLGVYCSLHKDTAADRFILICSAIGMSGPSFFIAILIAWLGAVHWRDHIDLPLLPLVFLITALLFRYIVRRKKGIYPHWKIGWIGWTTGICWLAGVLAGNDHWLGYSLALPGTGLQMTGSLYSVSVWDGAYLDLRNLILPSLTLMIRPLAVIVQLTRSSMIDVLSRDFIRTARAKGLPEWRVVYVHALRNALNPLVTAVSGWFASLLAGAVFVEFVFGWKGLGQELFVSIEKQDLPIVMGGVIIIASSFVLINILVDFIYGWIDPRVRR
jgi:peptide/nickel transport system permease protein